MTAVTDRTGGRCGGCGAALEPGAAFCGACGARTAAPVAGTAGPVADGPVAPSAAGPDPVPAWHASSAAGTTVAPAWAADADLDELAAPVWRRLVALLVDQVVAGAAGGLATLAVLPRLRAGDPGSLLVPALVLLVVGAAQWFAEAFAARTLGGALLGTRTVSARTGRPAGLWAVLVRSAVQGAGVLLGGIGLYVVAGSGAWDEGPTQRGWHDKAAGTLVLRAPRRGRAQGTAEPGTTPASATPAVVTWQAPVASPPPAASAPPVASAGVPVPTAARPDGPASPARREPGPLVGRPSAGGLPEATIPTVPELGDLEHTRLVRRAPVDGVPAPAALALVLGTGERVVVTRPTLVGRRPTAPGTAWDLVTVPDPGQSVSQTHLEAHPVEGGLEVLDRGSTNGTLLVDADGRRWSLPPGRPALVGAGWTLVLGNLRVAVEAA
ncbi:RDD family protein [Cellulomonas sp. C5510]|uniref:RDD family protein n=1 Tax=Cellulomonas sp. C5510 TaxID=2871170 RepID=UPI001C957EA0|nr:RDD family protein [Cellulomonas sp. C5510]QZN86002.1 RDD family protein [Cellulomonas sp. C5510]